MGISGHSDSNKIATLDPAQMENIGSGILPPIHYLNTSDTWRGKITLKTQTWKEAARTFLWVTEHNYGIVAALSGSAWKLKYLLNFLCTHDKIAVALLPVQFMFYRSTAIEMLCLLFVSIAYKWRIYEIKDL